MLPFLLTPVFFAFISRVVAVIKEHLEKSTTLEMNAKKTGVRRKGNMALP
jgi:hypothetical protein